MDWTDPLCGEKMSGIRNRIILGNGMMSDRIQYQPGSVGGWRFHFSCVSFMLVSPLAARPLPAFPYYIAG
jgi:hypothetical protein